MTCACNFDIFDTLVNSPGIPEFNPFMILYAEERIELVKPLENGTTYLNTVLIVLFRDTLAILLTKEK